MIKYHSYIKYMEKVKQKKERTHANLCVQESKKNRPEWICNEEKAHTE